MAIRKPRPPRQALLGEESCPAGLPTYDQMFNPLLQALKELGGSAGIPEMEAAVSRILSLSEKQVSAIYRGTQSHFSYRLAWTRNYLKRVGLLENSSRGIWALTEHGRDSNVTNSADIVRRVRDMCREQTESAETARPLTDRELPWQERLLAAIIAMSPDSFERLCQRLLREAGFTRVEVTGRSGDGGVDGKGIMRMGGFLSFPIIFQCKKYAGSVSASDVRDFRGAMVGRADKGLVLTTGTFTRGATEEATRDGAPPIDLVDGMLLTEKMKELGLAVTVRTVTTQAVEVDASWLKDF